MNQRLASFVLLLSAIALTTFTGKPAMGDEKSALAGEIFQLFTQRCGECHGKVNPAQGLNALDFAILTGPKNYVVPGDLSASKLWQRVGVEKDMPQDGELMPPQIALVQRWIERGAPAFAEPIAVHRAHVSETDVYRAMHDDLQKHDAPDRRFLRYYSLSHLHNNEKFTDADFRKFRAALAKLVNSLSWQADIALPQPVDKLQTVYRLDLRDLGWHENRVWTKIVVHYPFGLTFDTADEPLRSLASSVYEWTGTRIPCLRADWFVAAASTPPLYHEILGLPENDSTLEARLGVDTQKDFHTNRLRRAGFVKSNVSQHNRVVDRHPSRYGAYWKSYDFKSSTGARDITLLPLGPKFDENPFPGQAFEPDGGEIVFHLPNGLQAYLIVDNEGKRIDAAPAEVVQDKNRPLGSSVVVNGISCMVCHRNGMQTFQDELLTGHGAVGQAKLKVEKLYPQKPDMDALVKKDGDRFLQALEKCAGTWLRQGKDAEKPIEEFAEPIGEIVRQYRVDDLGLTEVACELGYSKTDELKVLFQTAAFRSLGMGVLPGGGRIKREAWEKLEPYSRFQEVADKLKLGTPERVFP